MISKNQSFIASSKQITMVCLDQLVNAKHQYRINDIALLQQGLQLLVKAFICVLLRKIT